jgi:hypothetical protein
MLCMLNDIDHQIGYRDTIYEITVKYSIIT